PGRGPEPGAGFDKGAVVGLEHAQLFLVQVEPWPPPHQPSDGANHFAVLVDAHAGPGELWRQLALDLLDLRRGIGARQVKEYRPDAIEPAAALLKRDNGVGKGGLRALPGHRGDFRAVLNERPIERRAEVLAADAIEGRQLEGGGPARRQWVAGELPPSPPNGSLCRRPRRLTPRLALAGGAGKAAFSRAGSLGCHDRPF